MRIGRNELLRRRLIAAAAVGLLVVSQAATSSADHNNQHVGGSTATKGVSFSTSVPIGPITVPVDFKLCVGTTCVQDENVSAGSGGVLKLTFDAASNAASVDMMQASCPKDQNNEQLLGAIINFGTSGGAGGASVSGSFTDTNGKITPLGSQAVPAQAKSQSGALRLCAMSPVA